MPAAAPPWRAQMRQALNTGSAFPQSVVRQEYRASIDNSRQDRVSPSCRCHTISEATPHRSLLCVVVSIRWKAHLCKPETEHFSPAAELGIGLCPARAALPAEVQLSWPAQYFGRVQNCWDLCSCLQSAQSSSCCIQARVYIFEHSHASSYLLTIHLHAGSGSTIPIHAPKPR